MMELNSGADNQQDWQDFDGDINNLLSSRPPTYLRQMKHKKSLCSSLPMKYEYSYCQCGCTYNLSICITYDVSLGVDQIHCKEIMVSCDVMLLIL
jgi:hypothetical protein